MYGFFLENKNRMKAWLLYEDKKSHNNLELKEVEIPKAGKGEILVKLHAISLNPVDYKLAAWGHPIWTYPHILGLDGAGVVEEVGEGGYDDVDESIKASFTFKKGDRVFFHNDLRRDGVFAEYVVVVAHVAAKIPDNVTFQQAAALPCAGLTAWHAIHHRLHSKAGQTVLVTGAAGGVGSFCIQILRNLGATVIGTASSAKHKNLKNLGASFLIDYTTENLTQTLFSLTNGKKIDAIIDTVSPESASYWIPVLKYNGQLAAIAGRPEDWNVNPFTVSPSIHEISLGACYSYGDFDSQHLLAVFASQLAQEVANGKIDPMIRSVIPFSEIPSGLEQLYQRHVEGKIVCNVIPDQNS